MFELKKITENNASIICLDLSTYCILLTLQKIGKRLGTICFSTLLIQNCTDIHGLIFDRYSTNYVKLIDSPSLRFSLLKIIWKINTREL